MNPTELNKILNQGEGTRVEFKVSQGGIPLSFYDSVCSFLNREGGVILLGVKDDGTVEEVELSIGTLLYVHVPISSLVHKHRNIIYDRENDSDLRVTDEKRIADLYARKREIFTENRIFPNLRIDDLDASLFDKVRSRLALASI